MAADVWMPYLGVEPHNRGLERIVVGYPNVYGICSPFIRSAGRTLEGALEMCQVVAIAEQGCRDLREGIALDVGDFFGDAAITVAHGQGMR